MTHDKKKVVVIIGAGFAGILAARTLRDREDVRVVLIDRNNYHLFQPLLYQVALSALSSSDITRPIRKILRGSKSVEVVVDEVVQVDKEKRSLSLKIGGKLQYDCLILAAGSTTSYFGHDEWAKFALPLKTIEDGVEIRRRLLSVYEAAQENVLIGGFNRQLHFTVIGGGPTGVELAAAITDISRLVLAKDYSLIRQSGFRVTIYEGPPNILSVYSTDLQEKALEQLEQLGVEVKVNSHVMQVEEGYIEVNGERILSDLMLWTAGVQPSPLGRQLNLETDKKGCVVVDEYLNPKGWREIFICGDLAAVTMDGRRIPGVAQPAMQMGEQSARMIVADLSGASRTPYRYFDKGDLATLGYKRAVARISWPFKAHWDPRLAGVGSRSYYIFERSGQQAQNTHDLGLQLYHQKHSRAIDFATANSAPGRPTNPRCQVIGPTGRGLFIIAPSPTNGVASPNKTYGISGN
jgi:NADH:ubiquinone reductase (H+-translocating)